LENVSVFKEPLVPLMKILVFIEEKIFKAQKQALKIGLKILNIARQI